MHRFPIVPNGGGVFSSIKEENLEYYNNRIVGKRSSFSLKFPSGFPKNCWFFGDYLQNAPALTDISRFKIVNCDSYEITIGQKYQSDAYNVNYSFAVKVKGVNENTAFYSDGLITNEGSVYWVRGFFIRD